MARDSPSTPSPIPNPQIPNPNSKRQFLTPNPEPPIPNPHPFAFDRHIVARYLSDSALHSPISCYSTPDRTTCVCRPWLADTCACTTIDRCASCEAAHEHTLHWGSVNLRLSRTRRESTN